MKYQYRITKYNPAYRKPDGTYGRKEWISYSDIGKKIGKKKLSRVEYLRIEDEYVQAVSEIMFATNVPYLKIFGLERGKKQGLKNGLRCNFRKVRQIVRGVLRESYWCILHLDRRMFVHFGWDYYMYVGVSRKCESAMQKIGHGNLFVESLPSPYNETFKRIKRRKSD
jgi:hypothetical protein